jgi:hypothetical protein
VLDVCEVAALLVTMVHMVRFGSGAPQGRKRNPLLVVLWWAAYVFIWVTKLFCTFLRKPILGPGIVILVVGIASGLFVAWWCPVALLLACLILLAGWFLSDREGFRQWWPVRWRYLTNYWPKWGRAMRSAKLTSLDPEHPTDLPKLKALEGSDYVDKLQARMLTGQTVNMFVSKSPGIAQTLGASGCRAVADTENRHQVCLWLWHSDPLKKMNPKPFPIPPPPVDGDWYRWFQTQMLYGIREDGSRTGIDLTRRLWLIVGKSRSGKSSSRVWPVVRMSTPMVKAGCLRYGVGDFKEGMELRAGKPIFEQNGGFYAQTIPEFAAAIRGEMKRMLGQAHAMGLAVDTATDASGIIRKLDHLTRERPWTVIIIDELKSLVNGLDYPDERRTIINALLLIQQIGLACGYSLIAGSQQGHKDILGEMRDGFTAMDCLAVEYESETHMLFEKSDIDQFMIAPHKLHIPEPEDDDQDGDQGIGWRRRPGYPRVRGTEVTNQHIWEMRMEFPGSWHADQPAPTEDVEEEPVAYNELPARQPEKLKLVSPLR